MSQSNIIFHYLPAIISGGLFSVNLISIIENEDAPCSAINACTSLDDVKYVTQNSDGSASLEYRHP